MVFVLSREILTKSVEWLDVLLPCSMLGTGFRTPVKGLVNAGAEPVFAFYLGNQIDEKLTINGVNKARTAGFRTDQM